MERKSHSWVIGVVMFIAGVIVGYWQAPRIMGWLERLYERFCLEDGCDCDCCDDTCDCDCCEEDQPASEKEADDELKF